MVTKGIRRWLNRLISRDQDNIDSSEERFRQLFEKMPEPVWIVTDTHFVEANPAALKAIGCTHRPSFLHLHPAEVSPEYQPDGELSRTKAERMARLGLEKGVHRFEWIHKRQDGSLFPVEVTLTSIDWLGKPSIYCTWRDVSERKQAEESLRRIEFSVNQSLDALFWIRSDASFLDVNVAACESLGYSREALLGLSVPEVDPAMPSDAWPAMWARLETEKTVRFESVHRTSEGRDFPVEISASYFTFGNETLVCAFVRDISKHKAAQTKLEQRTRLLESAQTVAHLGYYLTDHKTRHWTSSPMLDEIMGIDTNYGRTVENWGLLIHPEDRQKALTEFEQAIQRREPLHHQFRILRPCDGETVWVDAWGVFEYEENRPVSMLGTVMDVTERRDTEQELERYRSRLETLVEQRTQELAQSEERFRLAMEATHDGLWDWKVQTGDCYYSPGWFRMLGYEPEAFPAHVDTWIASMHPDERDGIVALAEQGLTTKGSYELEFRQRTVTGDYVWVVSRGRVVQRDADGKPHRAVGTHIDITERRRILLELADLNRSLEQKVAERTDQLQSANAAKSQFLAHMSHEIRTPMNAVLGLAQLLEKEPLEPGELAMVRHIREAGDSLLGIINDILDFSKIEAGQLRLDPQPFTLAEVLSRVDHLLRNTAESKGLALDVQPSPTDLGVLLGDPLRVEQILINLTGNAIKFTAKGGVTLSVRSVTSDEAGVRIRFEVQDTGIGIAPDVIGQLFKPFSQGDASITRSFGGTGLGLAISRRLADLMGGQMGVTSQVGQGSTFWFEIPLQQAGEQVILPSFSGHLVCE